MKLPCIIIVLLWVSLSFEMTGAECMSFRSYGIDFGLTDNTIRDIAEDKYGFLWIATDEGLNRISGQRIEKFYKSRNSGGLSGNELNCLVDDPCRPIMWIGTQRAGIVAYNYDTKEFTTYRKDSNDSSSLITDDVTDLDFDNRGNLWISTYTHGIDHLDVETGTFTHYNTRNTAGLLSDDFWCLDYDPMTGDVYCGHVLHGFSVISPKEKKAVTFTEKEGLAGNEVWDIKCDGTNVWLATNNGFSRYDTSSGEIENFNPPGFRNVSRAIANLDNSVLVAMDDHGVLVFDKRTHEFCNITANYLSRPEDTPEHIFRSDPNKIFVDSNGNVIVGTLYEGMAVFSRDTAGFNVLHIPQTITSGKANAPLINVRDITAGKRGVWFATNGNGLVGPGDIRAADSDIVAAICDNDDRVWCVGNNNRLTEANLRTGETVIHPVEVDGTRSVSFVSQGDTLWIGSNDGLTVFNKAKGTVDKNISIDRNYIYSLGIDRRGRIWVGSYGDGVTVIDTDGNVIKRYRRSTGLPSNTIYDICAEGDNVWLATGEGVVKVNGERLDDFKVVADSMRSIKSVVSDRDGNVWYATNSGIGVIKETGEKLFFDSQLPFVGFNNSSAARGYDGRLYFGANNGVLSFMPGHILSGMWLPKPVISALIINGSKYDKDTVIPIAGKHSVRLTYQQNNFTVVVAPSDFFIGRYSFEYRLPGLEDKWYPVDSDGKVNLRDIPYGKYEFQVRNSVMEDNENSQVSILKIDVRPPFWLSWWAKLTYLIIVSGLAVIFFRIYRNRLRLSAQAKLDEERLEDQKKLNDERVRFFTNVTHELRTPLTLINGPLEDLLKGGSLNDNDRWKVDVIHKNAQRLHTLVNQLLDYRKTETKNKRLCVSHSDIVAAVKDIAMKYVELNRNPNVEISVTAPTADIQTYFDKEVITMVLDNLISNAIKYTEAGMISISVSPEQKEEERWIRICVKDTGHGISQEALPHIFDRYYQEQSAHQASGTGIGLALVKALVELHNGEITVESAKGVGTCFNFYLKRDFDYPESIHIEASDDKTAASDLSANEAKEASDGGNAVENGTTPDNIMVLVVEDNPDILEYIRQSLSGVFDVKTATNGRDGLEIAAKEVPDVIVTDIMMPIMDGMQMTKALKSNINTSHIPIVMLTAKNSTSDRMEGYEVGVDSYITKPFNSSLLIARINNIVSRRHMLAEYLRKNVTTDAKGEGEATVATESKQFTESLSKLDREFIEKLDGIILDSETPDKVNIDYLTDALCMSRPTLYRKMKAVTGMSGNEYIRHVRMRRAKELLISGKFTMSEIAAQLGFSSPGYFRESFKAMYGKTPSDYIRQLKADN